jgi:hypothetical protein
MGLGAAVRATAGPGPSPAAAGLSHSVDVPGGMPAISRRRMGTGRGGRPNLGAPDGTT